MKLVLLGAHGAGKSTQAHLLSAALHLPYISTGAMLRAFASHSGEGGQRVKARLEQGDYFSDSEMIPLLEQRLQQADVAKGYILEGYPRTLAQAEALKDEITMAIYLAISTERSTERLLARGRTDDTPEIIGRRLEQHQQEAEAVLNFYRQKNILQEVNADRAVEEVLADIFSRLQLK